MTNPPCGDQLERVADQITQTIYCSPFGQATRRQQELALTCARKILSVLTVVPDDILSLLPAEPGVALCGQEATNG